MNPAIDSPDDEPTGGRKREPIHEFLIGIGAVAAVAALVVGGIELFG